MSRLRSTVLAIAASALLPPAFAQNICARDQSAAAIDARIDSLISQMTIDERIAQLQDIAPAIARLNLPAYNWWNEGLHGIARNGYATVFPQAIGLAATWDPALLHDVGEVVSIEARAKFSQHAHTDSPRYGGLTIWSPNINIFRDPRWGRGQETYGEDPFLTATLGKQFVEGIQGSDPFYLRADATAKHFAVHSGPETGRDSFNARPTAHDLADTYLPAFHALTTEAKAAAIMCSYNAIDGTPSCANSATLQARVRDLWHFGGYVVSDCDAVGNISEYHHYAADAAHGAAAALNAGTDLDCGSSYSALKQSFEQKLVTEAAINRSLHRLLLARMKLGMMDADSCSPYNGIGKADLDTPQHRALALRAAEESIVLLKNDGVLPLNPAKQSIAVIGPTADMLKILEATYHGTASQPVTPLTGLRESFKELHYAQGGLLAKGFTAPVPASALRVAAEAGSAPGLTAEYFNAASFDGKAAVTKVVDKVDFDFDRAGPDTAINARHFAARWHGYLIPPTSGDYTLRVHIERGDKPHDQFRLLVDDKQVIDSGPQAEQDRIQLHFADTAPHSLQLELVHHGEDEGIAFEWEPPAEALLKEAVAVASKSDVIIAFVGLSPDLEGEAMQVNVTGFSGGDRTSLDLPAAQVELLTKLRELKKPMVVVLTSGSAVALDANKVGASALLEAWYPGEEGGHALANILTGKVNPSGRLPVTFYRSVADLPAFDDYSMARRTYRYFNGSVLYPFGFGLSYAHFTYGPVHLDAATIPAGKPLRATVKVTNTGKVTGNEVAELYLVPPREPSNALLALAGMQRVFLRSGQSQELTFTVDPVQLSLVDVEGKRGIRAGTYQIYIGGAQPNLITNKFASFSITGTKPADF